MDQFKYSVNIPSEGENAGTKLGIGSEVDSAHVSVVDGYGGLSTEDAEDILYRSDGRNEFEMTSPLADWVIVAQDWLRQYVFFSLLAIALCIASAEWVSFILVVLALIAVTSLRFYNEKALKFENIVSTVNKHVPYSAMVKRDNVWSVIDSALLVPGDLILLEGPGTIVPADCRINPTNDGRAPSYKFNQSALTNDCMNLVTLYPHDSVKMMSILIEGSNIQCTVEFTGYDTYIGKMIAVVKVTH